MQPAGYFLLLIHVFLYIKIQSLCNISINEAHGLLLRQDDQGLYAIITYE